MSLASRMSSLFTTTTTTTATDDSSSHSSTPSSNSSTAAAATTAGGVPQSGSIHDDDLQSGAEFGVSRKSKRVRIMEDEEGEELESRPPYLHVCSPDVSLLAH